MPAPRSGASRLNRNDNVPRRRPAQGRSRATVAAILEAAARILRRDGEAGLTTNAIAELAGVSIGSLYAYFADREAILAALAEQLLDSDEAAIARALDLPGDPIRNLLAALVTVHLTDRQHRAVLLDRHLRTGHGGSHAARAQALIERLATRLPAAATADPVRYFVATRAVLGACRALTQEPTPPPAAVVVEELVALVVAYLGSRPARVPLADPQAAP